MSFLYLSSLKDFLGSKDFLNRFHPNIGSYLPPANNNNNNFNNELFRSGYSAAAPGRLRTGATVNGSSPTSGDITRYTTAIVKWNSLQCVERGLLPYVQISLTTHVHLLEWLHGIQQPHEALHCLFSWLLNSTYIPTCFISILIVGSWLVLQVCVPILWSEGPSQQYLLHRCTLRGYFCLN